MRMAADGDDSDDELGGGGADGAKTRPSRSGGGPTCPHCDGRLIERHCKYVCRQHGVVFDCADTFWL